MPPPLRWKRCLMATSALTQKAINLALAGDMAALRLGSVDRSVSSAT